MRLERSEGSGLLARRQTPYCVGTILLCEQWGPPVTSGGIGCSCFWELPDMMSEKCSLLAAFEYDLCYKITATSLTISAFP